MNKLLILILVLAAVLRFYKLDSFPVSLYWDEAAIGYNAYSISQTGSDEYAQKTPLLFRSFDEYKLPGYIYTDAFLLKFFPLSAFWVRFPSAFFGSLSVLLIYFLVKKISARPDLALCTSFLLAISPWHIQFSRAAFESNLALAQVLLGTVLIFYGFKNRLLAGVAIPILASSLYSYYSPRIFVPLILVAIFFLYKNDLKKNFKYFSLGLVISAFVLVPFIKETFSPQGLKRIQEVSIFEDKSIIQNYVQAKQPKNDLLSTVFLNRRIPLFFILGHNYFSHFSPGFLFFGDDPNPRHKSAFHGNLYLIEIPFLLIGLWLLLKTGDRKFKFFVLVWLLISPIPAAFAKDSPHGLRALFMIVPLMIISSLGFLFVLKFKWSKIILPFIVIISVINYLFTYYAVYPVASSTSWAYGYEEAFRKTKAQEFRYDTIIFTGYYWKPYIFYLFYNKINPANYGRNQQNIGKYKFGTTGWDGAGKNLDYESIEKLKSERTLLVISPAELEVLQYKERFIKLETVNDYSGKNAIFYLGEWH